MSSTPNHNSSTADVNSIADARFES